MTSAAQRRSPRVDVTLDITLQTVGGDIHCQTTDASYQGVFIVRREPLPLRKLVRFQARLPDTDEQLQMLGLVAHTVNAAEAAEQDRHPGMGIQLFSLGEQTRQRWRRFIDNLYEHDPQARETIESSQRPVVQMRIPDEQTLEQLRTVHIPDQRLFVHTPELHPEGTDIDCTLHHFDDETFTLDATVIEVVDASVKDRGIELDLNLPENTSDLERFLGGPLPDTHGDEPPEPPPSPHEADPTPDEENQQ